MFASRVRPARRRRLARHGAWRRTSAFARWRGTTAASCQLRFRQTVIFLRTKWSAESGECFRTLEEHQNRAMSATFASFCFSARREWSADSGECFCTPEEHQSHAMSATSSFVFVRIEWSAESGECLRTQESVSDCSSQPLRRHVEGVLFF